MRKHVAADSEQEVLPASLRSRKKQRTRQEIADAALQLFAKKGFDAVTVADVARAADVSEQTVYNYFKTKESLVFDEDEAIEARLVAMVRDRPRTSSLIDAARAEALAFLGALSRRPPGAHRRGSMPYLVATSASLRRHWLAVAERHGHAVARALVANSSGALSLPEAKILGASLVAVFSVIIDELGQTMKTGGDVLALIDTLRHQVEGALDRMSNGFKLYWCEALMSTPRKLQVMIVGAGTGGLCLAHGLLAAGIEVRVFERGRTPVDRLQGYRLTISATGNRALQPCLPKANFDRFVAASAKPNTGVNFLDHRLHRLLSIPIPPADPAAPESVRPVSRITLRQILLDGLAGVVSFDKTFLSFEDAPDGRLTVHFADGSTASGDVLIGADGAGSHMREQLLPQARRIDTGIVAVSGRFALDEAARCETPPVVFQGPTLFMGPPGRFMFASAVEYPQGKTSPYDRDEYVMWGFSARRTTLILPGPIESLSSETARELVLGRMTEWHPSLRRLVERAEAPTMTCFAVKSAQVVGPWPTRNVTLLGDALHNMTPFRGMGANTALRDAAALRRALVAVSKGEQELIPALGAYERDMIDYGFAAVRSSLTNMRRLHAESALSRFATKTMFRVADALPPMQRMFRSER